MAAAKKPKAFAKQKGKPKPKAPPKIEALSPPMTPEQELSELEKQAQGEILAGLEVLREIAGDPRRYEASERVAAARALISYGNAQVAHVRRVRASQEKPKEKVAQITLWDFE